MSSYYTKIAVDNLLTSYVTFTDLASALNSYVTNSSLANTLNSYVTIVFLQANYLTSSVISSTYATISSLGNYLLISNIPNYTQSI